MELSPGTDKKSLLTSEDIAQSIDSADALSGTVNQQTQTVNVGAEGGHLTVDQLDIEILPVIYDIIRCIEKDSADNTVKQREIHDCSLKIAELQKRLESARSQIRQLRGIDYNKSEQLDRLGSLRDQLKLKQQLLKRYRGVEY